MAAQDDSLTHQSVLCFTLCCSSGCCKQIHRRCHLCPLIGMDTVHGKTHSVSSTSVQCKQLHGHNHRYGSNPRQRTLRTHANHAHNSNSQQPQSTTLQYAHMRGVLNAERHTLTWVSLARSSSISASKFSRHCRSIARFICVTVLPASDS